MPATGVGSTNYFNIQDNNVFVNGFQFQDPNSGSNSTILQTTQTCTVQGCIFDGYGQVPGATIVNAFLGGASTSVFTFINNLVVDRATNVAANITLETNYNSVLANNTFVLINASPNQGGIVNHTTAAGVTVKVINNIMMGYAAAKAMLVSFGGTSITESFCLFSAASLTGSGVTVGSGNVYSQTAAATFTAATTNFRLLSSSAAINAGFTDTADVNPPLDIIGSTRPQGLSWDIGAYEFFNITSVGTGGGQAGGLAASGIGGYSIGAGGGQASGIAIAGSSNVSTGTGGGQASGFAVSSGNISVGSGGGQASGVAFVATGAIGVQITLDPIGQQTLNVPFQASGRYTLTPLLQFADDSTVTFTPIPSSGISALGTSSFNFVHPGVPTTGSHNLLVEDLVTSQEAARNYVVLATPPPPPPPFIPSAFTAAFDPGPFTSLSSIIPAYVYQEYSDDDDIQAFFAAYNIVAQSYLDWFNTINLPIYTGDLIVGPLLDWVAVGIYGIERPTLALTKTISTVGDFNTYDINTIDFNGSGAVTSSAIFTVTDDVYKRILTWTLYKGDGSAFNVIWLKRRVGKECQ